MKKITFIAAAVSELVSRHGTADPLMLCEQLEVIVDYSPMGSAEGGCKGFFAIFFDMPCITINNRLPQNVSDIVLAHELGHAVLHRDYALGNTLADFTLFKTANTTEREANLFAAELLIADDDIMALVQQGENQIAIAQILELPQEMIAYKFELLLAKGVINFTPPIPAKSSFLTRNLGGF